MAFNITCYVFRLIDRLDLLTLCVKKCLELDKIA